MMKNKSEKKRLDGNSSLPAVTIILLFVMYIVGTIIFGRRGFVRVQNFLNLFISDTGPIMVTIDMTTVMIIGGIDTSAGSVVTMVCMILAWMMERGNIGAFLATLIILVMGYILGPVQGFLAAYLKTQPFIVTLVDVLFARGMTSIISQEIISATNKTFTSIATFKMYLSSGGYLNKKGAMIYPYVYPSVIITLMVLAVVFIVLKYARLGRSIYAIGESEQSVLLLGLNVKRIKFQAYMLDGFLAGLGGLLFYTSTYSGSVEQTKGFEMDAIASSVISGILLTGGVGNVIGSPFEVLIKGTIESFIAFQDTLSSWWVRITIAAPPCFFIMLQSLVASLKRKNKQQEAAVSYRRVKINKKRLKV